MLKTNLRHLTVLAAASCMSLPAWADNCAKLATKTMCITATNSWGGHWSMNAVFGPFDPVTADGPATIGGNPGSYSCGGNNFARIVMDDSTGDRSIWIALVASRARAADGTGYTEPSTGLLRYKAVEGACPAAN
jgi:hypothetical protein